MTKLYRIEVAARMAGATARMLRLWEERGWLGTVERTGSDRRYTDEQVETAALIMSCKWLNYNDGQIETVLLGNELSLERLASGLEKFKERLPGLQVAIKARQLANLDL